MRSLLVPLFIIILIVWIVSLIRKHRNKPTTIGLKPMYLWLISYIVPAIGITITSIDNKESINDIVAGILIYLSFGVAILWIWSLIKKFRKRDSLSINRLRLKPLMLGLFSLVLFISFVAVVPSDADNDSSKPIPKKTTHKSKPAPKKTTSHKVNRVKEIKSKTPKTITHKSKPIPKKTNIKTTHEIDDIASIGDWEFKIFNITKTKTTIKNKEVDIYIIGLKVYNLSEKAKAPNRSNPVLIDDIGRTYKDKDLHNIKGWSRYKPISSSIAPQGKAIITTIFAVPINTNIKAFKIEDTPGDKGGAGFYGGPPIKKTKDTPAIFDFNDYIKHGRIIKDDSQGKMIEY